MSTKGSHMLHIKGTLKTNGVLYIIVCLLEGYKSKKQILISQSIVESKYLLEGKEFYG